MNLLHSAYKDAKGKRSSFNGNRVYELRLKTRNVTIARVDKGMGNGNSQIPWVYVSNLW